MAYPKIIYVLHDKARNDFDSTMVQVWAHRVEFVVFEGQGYEVLHCDKGVFHRSEYYWEFSPYGWKKHTPCNPKLLPVPNKHADIALGWLYLQTMHPHCEECLHNFYDELGVDY